MLVLSRTLGQRICIGDNIVMTVVEIQRGKIRLGFDAPREVRIFRSELLDRAHTANHTTAVPLGPSGATAETT